MGPIGKEHGCGHWATSTGVANGQTDSYLLELLGSDMTCPVHSVMYAMSNSNLIGHVGGLNIIFHTHHKPLLFSLCELVF